MVHLHVIESETQPTSQYALLWIPGILFFPSQVNVDILPNFRILLLVVERQTCDGRSILLHVYVLFASFIFTFMIEISFRVATEPLVWQIRSMPAYDVFLPFLFLS
jgi:hypothetical protein